MVIEKINHKGETIYLKKGWTGYRVVEPLKDPETNKLMIRNFFNKKGFITLFWLIFFLTLFYLTFNEQLNNYKNVLEDPCKFCSLNNLNYTKPIDGSDLLEINLGSDNNGKT